MPLLIEKSVSDILSLPIEETNSNKNVITIAKEECHRIISLRVM